MLHAYPDEFACVLARIRRFDARLPLLPLASSAACYDIKRRSTPRARGKASPVRGFGRIQDDRTIMNR